MISTDANTIHDTIRAQLEAKAGKVAGEVYIALNNSNPDMSAVVAQIQKALPEGGVIFDALVGGANRAFFKALKDAGLSAENYPVMSVGLSEEEVFQIGPDLLVDHYAASSYFQTIKSAANQAWVSNFKAKYGSDRVVGEAMEAAYVMVHLWAQAVEMAGTLDADAVRSATYGQSFTAPSGKVTVQPNHHLTKPMRIGQVNADGQFDILMRKIAIAPNPWSQYRPDSKGLICDWSDPAKGEKFNPQAAENTGS